MHITALEFLLFIKCHHKPCLNTKTMLSFTHEVALHNHSPELRIIQRGTPTGRAKKLGTAKKSITVTPLFSAIQQHHGQSDTCLQKCKTL